MPLEPLPWDRKDLFKERKHEKSEALGSAARWRDSYHGSREFNRWGSADFRRPTSHGKQGGWHQFSEESSHGYGPSRTFGDKMLEDESFRPSLPRGDGKYVRIGRESRGSFSHRDWRNHTRETNNGFANPPRRSSQDVSSDQRLVDDTVTYSSPQSDFLSMSDQIHSKDRNDKIGGGYGLENGPRSDVEVSLGSTDWKPLKWSRSGSLSSRGSAFSSSTNSKNEKADLPLRTASPMESPSAEATACVTSSFPFEETISRKKPRLGWGDGLAKYEKEKVEVPDVSLRKEGAPLSSSSAELTHSLGSSFAEKSPKTLAFSDCASPATPSSFACSSSSGLEEKAFNKASSLDNSTGIICSSPGPCSQNQLQKFSSNLEKLEISSIANLGPSLVELLHSDDPSTVESCFGMSALNKLLAYKSEISKTLEMTESEIDLLETELKSLKYENGGNVSHPKSCSAMHLVESAIYSKERDGVSNSAPRPAPLKIVSSSDATVEKIPVCKGGMGVEDIDGKDEEIDSPGTVTSKFNEPPRVGKSVPSNLVENDHCPEVTDVTLPDKMEGKFPISGPFVDDQKTIGSGNDCIPAKSYTGESISGDLTSQVDSGSSLCDLIFACNKEYACRAAEVIFKQLPTEKFKISTQSTKIVSCSETGKLINEKFAMRKQFLKFKESVLTLKFKAFQHSWKESLRPSSVKKCRSRPQKKLESSLRVTHSGYQKYRSSIRSRFVEPGASQNPAPISETISYSSKLLLNSQVRPYRNTLKMPAMILDKKEKMALRFVSNNGLVEDPCAVEKERHMINPWTSGEREIFWEKLSLFGKDFRKISSFLNLKTTADCIEFYYKNHKSDSFKKSKNLELGKQASTTTYLVTSGKKWNPDMNATSLDMLGVASVMAAHADSNLGNQQKCSRRLGMGGNVESKVSWRADCAHANKIDFDVLQTEKETVAADVLAGICGSLSSEAMGSCITSAIDPSEDYREWKCHKVDSSTKWSSTPDVMQKTDNDPCSDDSSGDVDSSNWTDEEKSIFMQAVSSYGRDFDMISRCVRSKSRDQCKVFFSKARKCLRLDLMHSTGDVGTPGSGNDASGSGTDTEDHCVVEICGARSSDEFGFKSADGLSTSVNINHEESVSAVNADIQTSNEIEESTALQQLDAKGAETVGNFPSDADAFKEDDAANLDSGSVCNLINAVTFPSQPVHGHKIEVFSDNTEAGSNHNNELDILKSESVSIGDENSAAVSESRPTANLAFGGEEKGSNTNSRGQSILQYSVQDSTRIGSNVSLDGRSLGLDPQTSHPNILKVDSLEKSCIKSEENSLGVRNSDPGVIKREQILNQDILSSTLDLQEVRDAHQKPMKRDDYAVHENHLLRRVESSEFPGNYPFNKPIIEDINRNFNHSYFPEVRGLSKSDIKCYSTYVAEDCYLQNCSSSKPHCQAAELPLLSQSVESGHDHQKDNSRSASDSDIPRRKGDVKLFGQILSHAPSNSNSGSNEYGEKKELHKSSSKSYDVEENIPLRSYGFWDGNRIQTGLSVLPDSAVLQAKYPAAFSGYSATSVKTEQQPLQALANSGDRILNGVSAFPTKDGVVDCQSYRSRDGSKLRTFPVDIFSEMHRRNGFEALSLSSLQQQGRVLVGMNVVGRGGILRGSSCTGVSDPVAAIKMHYAKAEQYVGQSGSAFTREDGSWRGNRDLGSR